MIWLILYCSICYYLMLNSIFSVEQENIEFHLMTDFEKMIIIFLSPVIVPYSFLLTIAEIFDKNK